MTFHIAATSMKCWRWRWRRDRLRPGNRRGAGVDAVELAVTGLRVWLGVVMIAHGLNHARSLDRTAKWFGSVGFKMPRRQAQVSALVRLRSGRR
jgi:putative oxidoreductase